MCNEVVSKEYFMLKYCPDRYKTQLMCNNAVNACLLALKFVPRWFVTTKMIAKLDNAVFSNGDRVLLGDIDSDIVAFFNNDEELNIKILSNVNCNDNSEDFDTKTTNYV